MVQHRCGSGAGASRHAAVVLSATPRERTRLGVQRFIWVRMPHGCHVTILPFFIDIGGNSLYSNLEATPQQAHDMQGLEC